LTAAIGLSYDYNFIESQILCDKAFTLGLCSSTDGYSNFFRYVETFSTQMSRGPYSSASIGFEANVESVENRVQVVSPIPEISRGISSSEFDVLLDLAEPVVFRKMASNWQAVQKWQNLMYLCDLGGHRLVPIELGSMLAKDGVGSKMKEAFLTFRQFIERYMVPSNQHGFWSLEDCLSQPSKVAYLAQHPLMEQMTVLRDDIALLDVFSASPKETMMWVGTGGTRTPLHFDSYDNLFVQVVGCKYVRLYAPDQTPKLYVSHEESDDSLLLAKLARQGNMSPLDCEQEDFVKHSMAADAFFTDVVLEPGDCLLIPAQTWHYVRSLTTSISVNFWL
jgi:Cupin-like domain